MGINADQAFAIALGLRPDRVLDIGSGEGKHAAIFARQGARVTVVFSNYESVLFDDKYDLVWASHVLEHAHNPGAFLKKCFEDLKNDGWLFVTVPPLKPELVGGHVTLWNEGVLLYQTILAGFDCSQAMVKRYGYNISLIVKKRPAELPELNNDFGDIEKLQRFFPIPVKHGDIVEGPINWPKN